MTYKELYIKANELSVELGNLFDNKLKELIDECSIEIMCEMACDGKATRMFSKELIKLAEIAHNALLISSDLDQMIYDYKDKSNGEEKKEA